jgi:hypothetical protein
MYDKLYNDNVYQVKIWKDPQYSESELYACDQICASEIALVPNNGKEVTFPIHPTNPATPIVYIATQKEQLITLRLVSYCNPGPIISEVNACSNSEFTDNFCI